MKTDIEIKDDIYELINGSELFFEVNGKLCKTLRPNGSYNEDIVISVLANVNAQLQDAFVIVNVYVKDVERDGQSEEATIRLRELCKMSEELFKRGYRDDFRYVLESQRVYPVDGRSEHVISNKILYKQVNE